MTLPFERSYAVRNTRSFLYDLLNPKKTPRVPRAIRIQARFLLKHYPRDYDIERLYGVPVKGREPVFGVIPSETHED